MADRGEVARAMAFFERSDDAVMLHRVSGELAPRAKRIVGQLIARHGEDGIPAPADLQAARDAATESAAITTLEQVNDFALLQVLARTIGQRIETLEILASAQFPEGARVQVPRRVAFPPGDATEAGTVESTGTMLTVRLDNGERWQGPPSLAQPAAH